ncbi:energy transducer TonB [Helicobacter sp. 13S00477-4]|uniref:energy transducer TonB n=1 Tax=Helicobacter sp. 13S00477-4 TaxID=1905759 RepID=UPI002151EC50|nr:energy transducer TonB [Helicobacter sp. 13S00477-4]
MKKNKALNQKMHDKSSEKRFIVALFVSILLHLLIVMLVYGLSKFTLSKKPHFEKIDASNLLILKRGQSQNPDKQKPGAPPPSLAAKSSNASQPSQAQIPKSNTQPDMQKKQSQTEQKNKTEKIDKTTQKKKQRDSLHKALDKYQKNYIDPKNLSLLSRQQALAFESPAQMANMSNEDNKGIDPQTQKDIDDLYGEEFGDLGSAEKDFIKNNLREIGRITQKYLEYPRTAAYLGQDGQNAIEFYLHPNGDITGLKILDESGSIILDRNSLKTIEIAYKDYPRPSVTTLIRIRVRYFMFR